MGLDYYLIASRKEPRHVADSECFLFERASLIGACMLSYFSSRLPAEYGENDRYREYPFYRLTVPAWDGFTRMLEEREEALDHLSSFVVSAFPFDDEVPEEYGDLKDVDMMEAVRFDRWFSSVFGFPAVYSAEDKVIELSEENCRTVIDRAYALWRWLPVCGEVREYLLDREYTVRRGRG